ncbi:MAG: monovalent cation/H(+) antiporter subunit G [Spirochaetales bacterium]|nr:monovalent cation/H(+) antiporter subunit G [Spirochaetales bacterium]
MEILPIIGGLVSLFGALFLLLGALGIVRMPDSYNRIQAALLRAVFFYFNTDGGSLPLAANPLICPAFSGYRRAGQAVFPLPPLCISFVYELWMDQIITASCIGFNTELRTVFIKLYPFGAKNCLLKPSPDILKNRGMSRSSFLTHAAQNLI